MAFWDSILRRIQPVALFTPNVTYLGPEDLSGMVEGASIAALWKSQPHLRTVVSFMARNVAQLGLHVFERVDETNRRRDRSSDAARALAWPDVQTTSYDLAFALVGDMLLYDRAYWYVARSALTRSGWMIRRLPPSWVSPVPRDVFTVASYKVVRGESVATVPASSILDFTGYSPTSAVKGSPTVEALRETLREQIEAARYRSQIWKRGGRVSSVIERPAGAPQWSPEALKQFREDWYAKFTGNGTHAGGTPVLEDGMTLRRIDFSAQEQQFVEAAKLSLTTVASAFHVNPTMIGVLDNANYSNVREFRRMLYGDSLGPLLAQVESRLNTFLLPMLGMDPERFYCEFNIAEKLQGSFEEQTQAMQASVGRPWMTADEARARLNLPSLGGDAAQLVTPLNVLVGGQASPTDSGSQNRNGAAPQVKAGPSDPQQVKAAQVLRDFFARQEKVVRSRLGAKSPDWWDQDRWDKELADTLHALAVTVTGEIGPSVAARLGFAPGDYDVDRTLHFLRAVVERKAGLINAATMDQIKAALDADDPPAALDSVWTVAKDQRSGASAAALLAFAAGFATTEAARQVAGGNARKVWRTGKDPRPTHAAMDGETVGLDEPFSNGMNWPGDGSDPDEIAGCNCEIDVVTNGES